MKRNSVLFGVSAAVGMTAAAGLVMAGATSSAAPAQPTAYGVAYATSTASAGFATGTINDPDGVFVAAAAVKGSVSVVGYQMPLLKTAVIQVATRCENGKPAVVITGGGASGRYTSRTTVSAATFTGNRYAVGSVTFLANSGAVTVGAYYDLTTAGTGEYVKIGAVKDCAAATSTGTPTGTSPTSPTGSSPTSPTGTSPTSTSPTSGPTSPSSSASPTGTSTTPTPTGTQTGPGQPGPGQTSTDTQPPTPTATTTTLPVTG